MAKNPNNLYTVYIIKKSINQSINIFYKKWPTPTFRCNSKEKSNNTCDALAHFFGHNTCDE